MEDRNGKRFRRFAQCELHQEKRQQEKECGVYLYNLGGAMFRG